MAPGARTPLRPEQGGAGKAEDQMRDHSPDLDQTGGERAQTPETDQKAKGLPGAHERVKERSQHSRLKETVEETEMKLIRDDPDVRSDTSTPRLQEKHELREFHNEVIQCVSLGLSGPLFSVPGAQDPDLHGGPFHLGAPHASICSRAFP